MQYARVSNELVTALSPTLTTACTTMCGDVVAIGWSYDGNAFTPPPPAPPTPPPPPPPIPVTQEAANAALAAGLAITSTGTPAVSGTYSLSTQSQAYINGLMSSILASGTFFNGATTQVFYDAANNAHTFPNVTVFKDFALAVGNFVDQVTLYGLSNGTQGSLPSNQVIIP